MSTIPVATGAITLDREKAKEKLRRFQLADPCGWLLELVRAAVVQGATGVSVRTDADDVRVSFNGSAFALADLEGLYEALLARRAPPARQHLAVALNGAMALAPRFVELVSRDADGGVRMRMAPGKPDQYGGLDDGDAPMGTTVWLRHPFRSGAFVEFFRARLGTQREIQALKRGCRFSRVPVTVNRRAITWHPPTESCRAVKRKGGTDGLVFRPRGAAHERNGVLVFTFRGVVLEEIAHPLLPAGLCAMLPGDDLTRDASLGAFVRDARWSEWVDRALVTALELCEQEGHELLEHAAHTLGPSVLSAEVVEPPAASGGAAAELAHLPRLKAALAVRSRPLLGQAVLRDVHEHEVTLGALRELLRAGREVPVASRTTDAPRTGPRVLLARDEDEMARVTHYLGSRVQAGEEVLERAEQHHRGLARLRERTAPLALHPGEVLGRARFTAKVARGIVALRPGGSRLRLVLFTDGCMIGMHDVECPMPGLSMALEGDFTLQPDCTDVVRDGTFTRALRAAFAALPDALADACANAREHPALPGRILPALAWALDAEALWHKLAAHLGCPLLEELPPLPPMHLEGKDRHPVCAVACLPRVDGAFASLDDVRGLLVPVVPQDAEQFSQPNAIKSGEVLRAVLARVARIEPFDELSRREGRRARLLREAPTLREPFPPAIPFGIGEAARGWVAFGGARPGIFLEAHVEGRALPIVHLGEARLGALRIVVDDAHLLPLADGTLAAADARRLVRAGLGAAGALLQTAAGGPGASFPGRRLALAILTAVAPSLALARAAEALNASELLALRALALATDSRELDSLVELALEAGNRPTVELIRELGRAAGSKLPRRGATDADPRAFVLAPLGGLRGLRELDGLSLRERILRRLPALGALELRVLGAAGAVATVQSVLDDGARATFVPLGFVVPEGLAPTKRILVLTPEEHDALRALLGPASLVDARDELREEAARRAHQAKPVEEARLDRGYHLGVVEMEVNGARGELGLLLPTAAKPNAHLRLLCGGRFVRRVDLSDVAPLSFAAILDDPELPVSLERPTDAARVASLAAHCVGQAERALDALVEKLPAERPDARVRACLLERLSLHDAHPIDLQRLGQLSQAPLVDTIHGRWLNFDQVLAEVQLRKTIACVAAAPRGDPPREPVLVMPAQLHRELLARAGAPVDDVAALWQKHVERQAALGRYPPLPAPPVDAFEVAQAAVAGVRATLWVAPSTRGEVVSVGLDARQIGTVPLDTVLPSVEGVVTGEAAVDPTFTFVHLARAWPAIDVAATALAARMLEQALQPRAHAAVREWCRRLALSLAAAPDAHGKRMGPLLARLRTAPLFAAPDGGLLTLEQVLAARPPNFEDELVAAGLVPAPALAAPTPTPAPLPPPPPSPEERLQVRLSELLALLALDAQTQAQLARWPLLLVHRKGKALVRFTRVSCEVDVEHEIGRAALEGNAAALDLTAAVVVAAANHHLDEIDENHEREFLGRMLEHAATRTV